MERMPINPQRPKKFTWFSLDLDEAVMVMHSMLHDLKHKYRSVYMFIEENDDLSYTVIAICSYVRLKKDEVSHLLNELPSFDWESYK